MRLRFKTIIDYLCGRWTNDDHNPLLWDLTPYQSDASLRKAAINRAKAICQAPCISITDKADTLSGDKHNYESIAYYAWPLGDGTWEVRDGHPSPAYHDYDVDKLYRISTYLKTVSIAYSFDQQAAFCTWFRSQLFGLCMSETCHMNPNMEYAQMIPGTNGGKGYPGGINEGLAFLDILDAIELMYRYDEPLGYHERIQKWFRKLNDWYGTSELGVKISRCPNNLSTLYDLIRYRIALYTGEKEVREEIHAYFLSQRLNTQIDRYGVQVYEVKRNKSMMYSLYNLQQLLSICKLMQHDGYSLEPYRDKISSAYSFIESHIGDKDEWPYTDIGDWSKYLASFTDLKKMYEQLFTK